MIKKKIKEKGQEKKFLRSSKRTSTHVLTTPDPIPDSIAHLPNHQNGNGLQANRNQSACLQKGLTVDRAGVYDTYHTTRKGEAPMSHLGQHGQHQSDRFGYQANWNGLSAYGDVWWGAGLIVPLAGNGCLRV